jgi:hypothetical protein
MPVDKFYTLPEKRVPFPQAAMEKNRCLTRHEATTGLPSKREAEQRLGKRCTQAASPRFENITLAAFMALGAIAVAIITGCFSGLLHLLDADAIGKTIQALLGG